MKSSLKKSVYLGLAALSFASVAGASLEATTASAAKKTTKKVKKTKKAAKKTYPRVTSVVNIANQDASTSAYTLKDGTLYNKPAGTKGAHTVATGLSTSENYMAYQTVKTNDGKTFYKVVSFTDHSHRGFVSSDNVATTATYTPSANNSNTSAVYLTNPGSQAIYTNPQGTTFKAHTNLTAAQTSSFASTPFGITQVATVPATGKTAYYIVNLNDNSVQGWVNADTVTTTPGRYFNNNTDLKINFNYNGKSVATQTINAYNIGDNSKYANPSSNDRVLTSDFIKSLFTTPSDNTGAGFTVKDAGVTGGVDNLASALGKIGYKVTPADLAYALQNANGVKLGDTIDINVSSTADADTAVSKLQFKSITPNAQGQWNPSEAKDVTSDEVNFPALNDAQQAEYTKNFTGNKNQFVNFNGAFGSSDSLFNFDGPFGAFDGAKANVQITSASQYTNGENGVLAYKDFNAVKGAATAGKLNLATAKANGAATVLPIGRQFHYAYVYDATATSQYNAKATLNGQPLTVIYDKVPVATPFSTTTTSGYTGYLAQ